MSSFGKKDLSFEINFYNNITLLLAHKNLWIAQFYNCPKIGNSYCWNYWLLEYVVEVLNGQIKLILWIDFLGTSSEIASRWLP